MVIKKSAGTEPADFFCPYFSFLAHTFSMSRNKNSGCAFSFFNGRDDKIAAPRASVSCSSPSAGCKLSFRYASQASVASL